MPAEIVLVRHGESTGNAASRASHKGNHDLFTKEVRCQESPQWPLTRKGIKESELVGDWIRNNIAPDFDHYFTSDYTRAKETAKHLGFYNSLWLEDILLRERNWGGVENLPYPERSSLFQNFGVPLIEDSMQWKPPNGESMVTLLKRIRSFLEKMQATVSAKRVILVSHGGPIQALRVLQHQIEPSSYSAFISGENYIRNCHVFHFSSKKNEDNDIPLYSLEKSAYFDLNNGWVETVRKI